MNGQPLISVIVPVYNVAEYLDQCLESIVNQTYRQLEILVIDDGSTDSSGAMCDRWAECDERIRVVHQPNGGLSAARNTALDMMTGELVIMVDSDDVLHLEAVSILLKTMQEHQADVVLTDFMSFYGNDINWSDTTSTDLNPRQYDKEEALMAIYYQQGVSNSSCGRLFKASMFDGVRYPVGQFYEDLAIVYPLYQRSHRVVKIDVRLYGYRQRTDSILGRFSPKRAAVIDICEQLEQLVQQDNHKLLPAVRSRLLSAYFNILLLSQQDNSGKYDQLAERCWNGIKRLRYRCLVDGNVRMKNKAGIIASYLGRNILCGLIGRKYRPKR
jgi:glycosyltransferase involved in cell wall biosynthesis